LNIRLYLRRHHYVAIVGIFLVTVALIAGMGGCSDGTSPPHYPITRVACGEHHTVGVKADGTVVAVGANYYGQCNVGVWKDTIGVAAGYFHTVGVKADGTVVAVGLNSDGQCEVGGW